MKNSQSVFNPQSTIFSSKNFEALLSDFDLREVGAGGVSTTIGVHVQQQGSCPPLEFTSSVGVHVHHRSSRTPSGFTSSIRVHVHHQSSRTPSGFTSSIRVHVHHRSSRTLSGFTSAIIPVEMTRRGGVKGLLSIHLMRLASSLEPSCRAGSYDTQTNMEAMLC